MDIITASEPQSNNVKPPADIIGPEVPPVGGTMEPLDVEPTKTRTKLRLYAILAALYVVLPMLALFIATLDVTVITISIPTICAELHSALGYVWIGGAYLLANAATSPIWAKFSDVWGRKIVILVAVALFAAASILAALSQNMASLIAGRALQGAGSGGITQLVAITISDLFSVRERSLYLGFMGFVWAIAGSVGPLIGGAFTQLASWRWCFWINLPICAITFGLLLVFLDVHNPRTKLAEGVRAIDWLGTVCILAVTLLILCGLDFGGAIFPWNSPKVICLIVFGTLMIGGFYYTEQHLAKYPLMPLRVFANVSNVASLLVTFLHGMVLIGVEYYLPLYFQSVKQASPLRSGILLIPLIVTGSIVEIVAGIVVSRTGRYRESIWIGTTLMTLGTGLYIYLGANTPTATIIGLEIIWALGPMLLFQGPMIAVQNTVDQRDNAAATASFGFIRSVAMSLSVVVGGVVFQNSMDTRQSSFALAGLDKPTLEALKGSQAAANVGIVKTLKDAHQRDVVIDAFAWSMRNMFIFYTSLAAVAMVVSVFIKHKTLTTEHTETVTGLDHLAKKAKTDTEQPT